MAMDIPAPRAAPVIAAMDGLPRLACTSPTWE
jgi:hypothetical protein